MAGSNIRKKVQGLISKLQSKYGVQTKQIVTQLKSFKKQDGEDGGPKEDWYLVDEKTKRFCLPKTMLFLGRDECDVVVQSQSVDKRHAVVTYDHYLSRFKIKDLSTANGTYVNESRIPEQEYVTLNHMDSVRLGYDTMLYHVEQGGSIPQPQFPHSHSEHLPGWASREAPVIDMAECEGCIAEQQIHHTCVHQTESSFVDMHRSFGKKDLEDESKRGLGSNTWPRKRLRQVRHHPHIASVFSDEGQTCDSLDQPDGSMTNNGYCYHPGSDGPHHPSCENSMYGEQEHCHSHVPTCMCYANNNADYLDYAVTNQSNGVTRIPRSGSKHILPPELETVKKGTPLYGQPDWWGEDDDTESYPSKPGSKRSSLYGESDDKSSVQAGRPRSLSLEQKEALSRMEKSQGDPEYGIRYMEIPAHRILDSEREKETPPRSISSSISKDSLFSDASKMNTPDTPGERSSKEGTPDRLGRQHVDTTPMAFTIDFGDDDKKDNKMPKSLSECVPSKIRKSFRERKEKAKQNKEAMPNKSEEEREMSPQQKKQDDTGSTTSDTKPTKKTLSSKRSSTDNSVHKKPSGEKSPPTKSSENGETAVKTDTFTKSSRTARSKKSPISGAVRSTNKSPKVKSTEVPTIDPTQYKDPTSYLIDKMFEGNGSGKVNQKVAPAPAAVAAPAAEKNNVPLTEHDLYRESMDYDTTVHNGDSNGDISSASNLKVKKSKESNKLVVSKDQKEDDKVSEAGTYTIEADEDSREEEEARKNIDRVFGVEDIVSLERPVIDVDSSDEENGKREVTESADLALKRSFRERGSSMEVEAGSADTMEDLDIPDDIDLETFLENQDLSLAAMSTTDVPKWVSQWAALAKQKALKKSQSLDLEEGHNNLKDSNSQKPPNGRKRPGTGRKLPSIPTDRSPCSSDYSANIGEISPRSGDATPRQEQSDYWPADSPTKPKSVTISSQVVTHYQETNGDSSARGRSESGSEMNGGETTQRSESPTVDSSRTNTSMDTEVLLKDTETVMAAMEARMASRAVEKKESAVNGFSPNDALDDSDSDSMVAMVNGDDQFVKPSTFSSPRESLAKRSTSKKSVVTSTPKKPPLGKSLSVRDQNVTKPPKNRSYSLDNSTVSDIYSESSELGDSESYRSDVSSDNVASSTKKNAKKGVITNTKPNRAFALRRAKADGPEESPRSSRSSSTAVSSPRGSSNRTASSSRAPTASSTARSTARSKSGMSGRYDSGKSEVSLGAEIVKKSRENVKADASFDRKDGGRYSLRSSYKTNSQKTLSVFNPAEATRRTELKNLKTQLRKSEGSKGLSVSGHAARSQSQPGSRSNSPKAAERMAWKRRKEYDPRKAVANAKAKAKDAPRQKPLSASQSSLAFAKQKMFRSASFTNSVELSGRSSDSYRNGSISSAEDISLTMSEAIDSFDERGLRRAFIPMSGPLRNDRISHSADEDDSSLSVTSSQDLSRSMLGNAEYKSAFTPPLQKQKSPSMSTSSPLPSSARSTRRRTIDCIEFEENQSRLSGGDSPQSYDTLLITSIYQLSLKLKTATDRTLSKLRDNNRVSATPSPIDDFLSHTAKSEIPAWKSANQELAGILKNLRKIEHHQQVMERALFPDEDSPTEVSRISSREKQKYFQEIQRIRSELQGFHFIDKPECEEGWKKEDDTEETSPDMEEIGEEEFY